MDKYLRAISFNYLYFVFGVIFFLVITPIAIRSMGDELFGLWSILNAVMLFSNVGTVGISSIIMKFSAEAPSREDLETQANRVITSGSILIFSMALASAIILILLTNVISDNILTTVIFKDQFRSGLLILAIGIFPQFLSRVPHGFLLSRYHNREARQLEFFSSAIPWLGAILIVWISKNLIIVSIWYVVSNFVILFFYVLTVHHITPIKIDINPPTLKRMMGFSGYMFLENLAIALFQHIDKVIVGFTLGPAIAGAYSVGTSLALRLSIVTGISTEVMIPYASLKDSIGDRQKLLVVFRQLSHFVSLLLAGIGSLAIIWMQGIISLWISPDYADHYADAFRLLIVAYAWISLTRPAHQTLTGMGKVKFTSIIYFFSTLLMLICVFFFSTRFGLLGAVLSNLIMVFLLFFNLFVYHLLDVQTGWMSMFRDLKWGLILPIFVYILNRLFPESYFIYKLVETMFLVIIFSWAINRDVFLKKKILQMVRFVLKIKYSGTDA